MSTTPQQSNTAIDIVKRKKELEEQFRDGRTISRIKDAIGELDRYVSPERALRTALSTVFSDYRLTVADPMTTLASVAQIASVGLIADGFLGQAWLIAWKNSKRNCYEVKPMIGFRGFGELIVRSGKANSLDAQVVRENDAFEFEQGSDPFIRHKRSLFKRGEPIAAYAVIYMKEGPARFEIMDIDDLDKIRAASKGSGDEDSPWNKWWDEMARKSPIRRLVKFVSLSGETQRASTIDEGSDLGYSKYDPETGAYIIQPRPEPQEKPRAMSHTEMRVQPQTINGHSGDVMTDTTPTPEVSEQDARDEAAAGVQPNLAEKANPFAKKEVSTGQRELTLDRSDTQERAEPGTKHVSEARVKRLFAILHAAQKVEGSGAPSDEQLRQHVQSLGFANETLIPNDKEVYDSICDFAGGKAVKVGNGKKG